MEKKGLCGTCNADQACVFQRGLKVLECEEFDDYVKQGNGVKLKFENAGLHEETTEAE